MAEKNVDFDLYAGETVTLVIDVVDKDAEDAAKDLTGATGTFIVKRSGTTLFSKTVGSGITLSTSVTGRMTVSISAANTSSASGTYSYQCRMTLADGTVVTVIAGSMTVLSSLI